MAKAVQYSTNNGSSFTQFAAMSATDLELDSGAYGKYVPNYFECIKDSHDTLYILCAYSSPPFNYNVPAKIIKFTSAGVKTFVYLDAGLGNNSIRVNTTGKNLILSRDETTLFLNGGSTDQSSIKCSRIFDVKTEFTDPVTTYTVDTTPSPANSRNFIFKDLYYWYYDGAVHILNYDGFAELDSETAGTFKCAALSKDNILYGITASVIEKFVFTTVLSKTSISVTTDLFQHAIEAKMDKDSNILILTNDGSNSTILKFEEDGTQVGSTLDLGGVYYNLNTDYLGNIFYSNAFGTYKSPYNATGLTSGTIIRGTGLTSYGNNITGYEPATNAQ